MEAGGRLGPSVQRLDEGEGIEVVDPVEHRRYALGVPGLDVVEADPENPFVIPVDTVVAVDGEGIHLAEMVDLVVRDGHGAMIAEVPPLTDMALPAAEHYIELNGPVKVYLSVESAMTISASGPGIAIEFPGRRRVHVGARSYHRHPAATITTPTDPESMAAAISALGSALKTTSPERAYPTLRGHPPAIELGDELAIPSALDRPATGVTLEVPATYASLFSVAPLAYYLGAEVTTGERPRLMTDDGFDHALGGVDGIEDEVERVLKQTFLLDCVTRTEGIYRIPLAERASIEPHVDLDFGSLYDQSPARRLEAYLEVPFETVEPVVPTWNLIAHIPPTADQIEVLPYVIDNLAIVRTPSARTLSSSSVRRWVLSAFADGESRSGPAVSRSARSGGGAADERVVRLPSTDSMEDAWFGEAAPLNATKALPAAYRNRLERSNGQWPFEIAVVCNDSEMATESAITDSVYGAREDDTVSVARHRNLTMAELRSVLAADVDFLHYIGHTTADGFDCRDGRLDAATLETVGVGAFFLNSCQSYRQGVDLIEAGSVGGVVTLSEVNNEGAATVGWTMAELLRRGFPLRAALELAARTSVVGGHYIVVGDGTADMESPVNGLPLACRVTVAGSNRYEVTVQVFLPREGGMGTTVYPLLESNEQHFLTPGDVGPFQVTGEELLDYLTAYRVPMLFEGELLLDGYADRLGL